MDECELTVGRLLRDGRDSFRVEITGPTDRKMVINGEVSSLLDKGVSGCTSNADELSSFSFEQWSQDLHGRFRGFVLSLLYLSPCFDVEASSFLS
jgi:hypothetical protein